MAALWNLYDELWTSRDQRVDGWLFMSSLKPSIFFIMMAFSVLIWGPRYMKTRPPLNIGPFMGAFNVFVVIFNVYIACQLCIGGYRKQYDWFCEPNQTSDTDDEEMRIVETMHLVFLCKLVEMLDSFLLIARKKSIEQSGVLVTHHAGAVVLVWVTVRWVPGSSLFFGSIINSTAHAIMYAYFGLAYFQPTLVKSPLIKLAYSCFLIVQGLVSLGYCLITIWIQCPWTVNIAYAITALLIGTMVFQGTKGYTEYRRGNKSAIIASTFKLSSD